MKTKWVSLLMVSTIFLVACQGSMPSNQTSGAVLGGVAGGLAGSQIGKGKGRDAAMVVGTLLGAALGGAVGSSMDRTDAIQTQQALQNSRLNQQVSWTNPQTQNEYTVTPTNAFQNNQGEECRDYTTVAIIGGERKEMQGTACRQPDGSWKAIN